MTRLAGRLQQLRAAWPVYLMLSLAGLSILLAVAGTSSPHREYAIENVMCQSRPAPGEAFGAARLVTLPYLTPPSEHPDGLLMRCTFEVNAPEGPASDTALYVPTYSDSISVELNDQRMAVGELLLLRNLRFVSLPAFAPLRDGDLRPGTNQITITLSSRGPRPAALDRVFFGPAQTMRPFYQTRWLISAVVPTLIVGGQLALALVFGMIFAVRRNEAAYGWLTAMLALGATRGSVLLPDFGVGDSAFSFWNMLVPLEALAALMFTRTISGVTWTRSSWVIAAPPAILWLIYLIDVQGLYRVVILGSVVMVLLYVLGCIWTLARGALRGSRDSLMILFGMTIFFAFAIHDALVITGVFPSQVFLARTGYTPLLITVCTLMVLRFIQALRDADQTADLLRARVEAAEEDLRATFEELRVRREAEAVEQERNRLMRDLHDGLGGELASMLALADAPSPSGAEIAGHARAALADMRLIISSLEDYGGDLTLALAAWRERAEPQVRAAGLTLDWKVRDLPALRWLGPQQVLDILRIVQEGVTNTIKHAGACKVTIGGHESPDAITITISDDGNGDAAAKQNGGHGLRNMAARAQRLGAELEFGRAGGMTALALTLPREQDAGQAR